ncbi:2Fe-2S iron-sulfur cluster-binding protein [Deltaproteobacteria bacterium TL4]
MLEITINGKKLQANRDQTVLEVALDNGIQIPYLCYHPQLSIAANCRICLVKLTNSPKLQPACNTMVSENMQVDTVCDEVKEARKTVMQFLTLDHPVDCGICDKAGECKLQEYHFAYNGGACVSKEPKKHKQKYYDINDRIVYDAERCVLCSRCVRFSAEISKTNALGIVGQGSKARVAHIQGQPYNDPYSDNVVDLCPVGALLSKDFMYQSRVWYLEKVPFVCPGCETGCAVYAWRKKKEWRYQSCLKEVNNRVFRVSPRKNATDKGPWICNFGRDSYKFFEKERLNECLYNGKSESLEKVLNETKTLMKNAAKPAVVISLYGSNEEMKACQEAFDAKWKFVFKDERTLEKDEPVEDDLLIRKNKNPNLQTAKGLFKETGKEELASADVVLVWGSGFDLKWIKPSAKVIYLTSFKDTLVDKASIAIPISTMLEQSGSFTNFENKTQKFEQVFEKPDTVYRAADIFKLLKGV